MKKAFKIFVAVLFLGVLGLTNGSTSLTAQCTFCKVSSNPDNNDGHCREGETGDICYDGGSGPACSENGFEEGDC